MNIFFFTFEMPPTFGGGLATYIREICNVYKGKPDQVTIFCVDHEIEGPLSEERIHENILVIKFRPFVQTYYGELGYWTAVSNELSILATSYAKKYGAPDVIETADGFGIGYIAIQKRLCLDHIFKNIPVVTTAHTPTFMQDRLNQQSIYRLPNYWHKMMETFSLAAADFVVSPSRALLDKLKSEFDFELPNNKVIFNPYQSNLSAPKPALDTEDTFERDHFYMASRLTYWKGAQHIVEVFDYMWKQGLTDAKLILYGDDTPYETAGCSMAEYLSGRFGDHIEAGRLELAGKQPRDVINERAQTAYGQIHPSLFDNLPYTVLEGMDAGTITIVHKDGGHNELIDDGKNAFVMDVTDPEAAAASILRVTTLSESDRYDVARNAHETIRAECSYEKFYEQKQAVYANLVKRRSANSAFPFVKADAKLIEDERVVGEEGLLSVVIPYFNMGDFIDETLASVMDCSYPSIEIVLVDDGSTDQASVDKLSEIETRTTKFPIRILRTKNQGVAKARNTGVKEAKGQFLALLDADDLIRSEYYGRAIDVLKHYSNVAFVGCWNEDFNDEDGKKIRVWPTYNTEPPMQMIFNSTNCQGLVYWRAAFEKAGEHDPDLRMFLDDWESTIALMAAGYYGVMIPEALFRYRIRSASIFRSKRGLWALNYEKIALKHRAYFDKWGAEIACFMNANGPNEFYHNPGHPTGLPGHSSEKNWLTDARDGGYLHIVEFFSRFIQSSFIGKRIRSSSRIQKLFESVMNKL